MEATKVNLRGATCIDFTGTFPDFKQFPAFDDKVVSLIRKAGPNANKVLLVVDRAFGTDEQEAHIVTDHINLTGSNPLVGPNDDCGERFPIVKDVYITGSVNGTAKGVAAGVKAGVVPTEDELGMIKMFGANFYCYNLVPTMIIAAHAGWKVIGVAVPPNVSGESVVRRICEEIS